MKKKVLLDKKAVDRTITRITHEILEKNEGSEALSLIGIRTRGVYLANRIQEKIRNVEGTSLPFGVLDITLYRDDISKLKWPEVKKTEIPFDVDAAHVILIDDVLYTGRTVRAALEALVDFGRPSRIELAVLVDRGHREMPIEANYAPFKISTTREERINVHFQGQDGRLEDEVVLE